MDAGCVLLCSSPRPALLQHLAGQTHIFMLLQGVCIPKNHRIMEWFLVECSLKPFLFHAQAGTLLLACPKASSILALGLSWVPGSILEHILAPWVEQPLDSSQSSVPAPSQLPWPGAPRADTADGALLLPFCHLPSNHWTSSVTALPMGAAGCWAPTTHPAAQVPPQGCHCGGLGRLGVQPHCLWPDTGGAGVTPCPVERGRVPAVLSSPTHTLSAPSAPGTEALPSPSLEPTGVTKIRVAK